MLTYPTARDQAELEMFADIERIKREDVQLEAWAKDNGMSKKDAFELLINRDTMSLKTTASQEYYEDLKKAREDEDIKWFKANTAFNEEAFERDQKKYLEIFEDPSFDPQSFFRMKQISNESDKDYKERLDHRIEEEKNKFADQNDPRGN